MMIDCLPSVLKINLLFIEVSSINLCIIIPPKSNR